MNSPICALVVTLGLAGTALAQPGLPPRPTFGDAPGPAHQLTDDEESLLDDGFISTDRQIGGGLTALMFGFGFGQTIEGRWHETGWIFTLGDGASAIAFAVGMLRVITCRYGESYCHGGQLMALGVAGTALFRVWGTIDAFHGPAVHNRRLSDLRMRLGLPTYARVMPYVAPPRDGNGAVGGVSWSF